MSRADRTGWKRVPSSPYFDNLPGDMWLYQKNVEDGHLTVIVGPEPDGFHMSISHRTNDRQPGRYPSWDEIMEARWAFCPADMTMVMRMPPKEEYVNVHSTTFHLWEEAA